MTDNTILHALLSTMHAIVCLGGFSPGSERLLPRPQVHRRQALLAAELPGSAAQLAAAGRTRPQAPETAPPQAQPANFLHGAHKVVMQGACGITRRQLCVTCSEAWPHHNMILPSVSTVRSMSQQSSMTRTHLPLVLMLLPQLERAGSQLQTAVPPAAAPGSAQ